MHLSPLSCLSPRLRSVAAVLAIGWMAGWPAAHAATETPLWAGVAKVEITVPGIPPVDEPWFVKALVIGNDMTHAVIISVDAVALGEIGSIRNDYVPNVRTQLQQELNLTPANILFNATHRHGSIAPDIEQRTLRAVREAWANREPVVVAAGTGHEDRIQQNRRIRLKNGREADLRHAYALPPDDQVASAGPIDPEIGILRLDRRDGRPLAVLFNFAIHPNQSAPHGAHAADVNGFAANLIEDALGHGAVALFVQGCAGDIAPIHYKDYTVPRPAEPLGHRLGSSTLRALRQLQPRDRAVLGVSSERLVLPRADNSARIAELEAAQVRLLQSLKGTPLNLKTFLPLLARYSFSPEFPSADAHRYHHEQSVGASDLVTLDADNRQRLRDYIANIHVMEELIRLQTNLTLLKRHQARNQAAGKTIEVEVMGLRVGDFRLITFPGELTVQIGLNIKQASPHELTFIAGYSNGYIHYCPTADQLRNAGHALEDSQTVLAPAWQELFERKAQELLQRL